MAQSKIAEKLLKTYWEALYGQRFDEAEEIRLVLVAVENSNA